MEYSSIIRQALEEEDHEAEADGGAVQVDSIKTRVESAPGVCNQRLKLKCDEPLSNFAFKFNLRLYTEATLDYFDCLEDDSG